MADRRKYPTGVRPGARGGIEIRWSAGGKQQTEYLAENPTTLGLKRAAKLRKERIEAQQLINRYGLRETDVVSTVKLFADIAQEYLDRADLAATTRGNYKNALNKYWIPELGEVPIAIIAHKDIKRVLESAQGISRKTKKNIAIPLRQVFKFAIDEEYLEADPSTRIRLKKNQKPPPDPFSLEEREAILSKLSGQAYCFFLIAFETGMRSPSEILALQWPDFDGECLRVTKARVIRKMKETKTHAVRSVLVTKRLKEKLLQEKMRADPEALWMFINSESNPCLDADVFNEEWKAALKKASVRYRRPYNCRHTYASLGLKAGARPAWLASQLGHTLQMFFTTYAKWISEEKDTAELKLLEKYFSDNSAR